MDGSGAPAFPADVLVEPPRIVEVGQLAASPDAVELDATGCVVAPGFVDIHTHSDASLFAFPTADSAVRQGVTTVVIGNCGTGLAPVDPAHDVRRVALAYDAAWPIEISWRTFGEYLASLPATSVNVGALVPHGAVRNAVMGLAARSADDRELRLMRELVSEALQEGALGLSTGLEYQPGCYADLDEIALLASEVGKRDKLYASHIRNRADTFASAVEEALAVGERGGVRVQVAHAAPRPYAPRPQTEAAFSALEAGRARGLEVGVDTFPEIWGPGTLVDLIPPAVARGTPDEVVRRLECASVRREVAAYQATDANFLIRAGGLAQIFISTNPAAPALNGRSLTELAAERRVTPSDLCCDVLVEAGPLLMSVGIRHLYATEDDLRSVLRLPYCCLESDGVVSAGEGGDGGYPWNASSYGYCARVLDHYVREVGLYTIEDAIRRMTSLPAAAMGLSDRGKVESGVAADLVIFDPATIVDRTTPTEMAHHPSGIRYLLVNGTLVVSDGRHTGALPGRLL